MPAYFYLLDWLLIGGFMTRQRGANASGVPQSIGSLLSQWSTSKKKYVTREFQDYGYRLATELGDERNKSLYIKLAKEVERKLLERARVFVKDANQVRSRAKLFMWALARLRRGESLYEEEE